MWVWVGVQAPFNSVDGRRRSNLADFGEQSWSPTDCPNGCQSVSRSARDSIRKRSVPKVSYLFLHNIDLSMPNVTLSVPDELHREMRAHPEIKWAEVARSAFRSQLRRLDVYDRLLSTSRLTERDAIQLGREIRRAASRRKK